MDCALWNVFEERLLKLCMVGLEITPSEEGIFVGGAVNNVVRISKGLWERGHQIHIVTTPARYSKCAIVKETWAEFHPMRVFGVYPSAMYGFDFTLRAISEIRRLHKEEKFEVIHGHSGYPAIAIIPSISGKMLGVPSVHTLYCPIEEKTGEKHNFQRFSNAYLVKNFFSVDKVIAISNNVKSSLENAGFPREKIGVIPPAIDTSLFNPTLSGERVRASLGINADEEVILFVGNLTKTKGVHVLVKAMRTITKVFSKAKLLIVLHVSKDKLGEETRDLRAKINSLHLQKNVVFMGISQRMPEVIAACDVFVAPFLSTAGPSDYPLPILEAMAVGKPVVATNVGGIPEIISSDHNGILVRPNDPAHLAEAVVYLLKNIDAAKAIGQTAASFARENFATEKVVKMIENVYEELLDHGA